MMRGERGLRHPVSNCAALLGLVIAAAAITLGSFALH